MFSVRAFLWNRACCVGNSVIGGIRVSGRGEQPWRSKPKGAHTVPVGAVLSWVQMGSDVRRLRPEKPIVPMNGGLGQVAQAWRQRLVGRDAPYGSMTDARAVVATTLRSASFRRIVRVLHLKAGASMIEAGIGSGRLSLAFAALGCRVTALDCVPDVLIAARRAARSIGATVATRLSFVCGDLEKAPIRRGAFDVVFNEGVVEHWLDLDARRQLLATMGELLRPGGTVCVVVPNGHHPLHGRWMRTGYPGYLSAPPMTLYGPGGLCEDLVAVGVQDVRVDGLGPWQSFNLWPHRPLLRVPLGALDRLIGAPRWFRLRYGTALCAVGRRPEAA